MKQRTVQAQSVRRGERLDSHYFLAPGVQAKDRVDLALQGGMPHERLGAYASVWMPSRYKRIPAASGEKGLPYLRPYDVFDYLPRASDVLSPRTAQMEASAVERGMILQTRSGRNLGPCVMADSHLAQFVLSDDMVRVEVEDEDLRYYTYIYFRTPTGQQLLRRDKSGSVIDHISPGDVADQTIPMVDGETRKRIRELAEKAFLMRESARTTLLTARNDLERELGPIDRDRPLHRGWGIRRLGLSGRIDAAFYDPVVEQVRKRLEELGGPTVAEVADVSKPRGRYKTIYVEEEHGTPILSGGQLLQVHPINLKFMSPRAFREVDDYRLETGMIAYPADGRAEQALGTPVMVTSDRNGWLASGHISRITPEAGVCPGSVYLACATTHVQMQIKSKASGSVVDSTFERDMETVQLPQLNNRPDVQEAWELFVEADSIEREAGALLEAELDRRSGETLAA